MAKLKWPKPVREMAVPLFGGRIYLFTEPAAYAQACAHLKCSPPSSTTCVGVCNQFDGEDGRVVYLIGNFSQKRTVLVHEAAHATLFILNRAGVDSRDSNGEVYCYLLDSILEGLGLDD